MIKNKLYVLFFLLLVSFPSNAQTAQIDKEAPNFKLWFVDGTTLLKKELLGKTVVLKFWFTSCQACLVDFAELNALVATYKDNPNVLFLAPALDDKETLQRFLTHWDFKFKVATAAYDTAQIFNPKGVYPTYIIIDKNGFVRYIDSAQKKSNISALAKKLSKLVSQK